MHCAHGDSNGETETFYSGVVNGFTLEIQYGPPLKGTCKYVVYGLRETLLPTAGESRQHQVNAWKDELAVLIAHARVEWTVLYIRFTVAVAEFALRSSKLRPEAVKSARVRVYNPGCLRTNCDYRYRV